MRGLVIDAGVRDVAELTDDGVSRLVAAISAQGTVKETPGNVQTPIVCAGVLSSRRRDRRRRRRRGGRGARASEPTYSRPRARAPRTKQAKRERAGERRVGLDIYDMRERLRESGLTYIDGDER